VVYFNNILADFSRYSAIFSLILAFAEFGSAASRCYVLLLFYYVEVEMVEFDLCA